MIDGTKLAAALERKKVPEAKRRVIAAVMLLHDCDFEEAAASLEAAVQERLRKEPRSVQWQGSFCLTNWVMHTGMQIELARRERPPCRILRLVSEAAE